MGDIILTFDFSTVTLTDHKFTLTLPVSGNIIQIVWGSGPNTTRLYGYNVTNPSFVFDSRLINLQELTITISRVTNFDYKNLFLNNNNSGPETNYEKCLTSCSLLSDGVYSLENAFKNCKALTSVPTTISTNVTNLSQMFANATKFNGNISEWNVSLITNMSYMFYGASTFNGDISAWDVNKVKNMDSMFRGATAFNGNISGWKVGNVTTMKSMFRDAIAFNQNINNSTTGAWNVGKVTDMSEMFYGASTFNGDISAWDVNKVENMDSMFRDAKKFNGNITAWKVGDVINMSSMFQSAIEFNQNINYNSTSGAWNVGKVTDMSSMFQGAYTFNGDITLWNIGVSVTGNINMSSMFRYAIAFNQDLNVWDVNKVTTMSSMFSGATLFNGDITAWKVGNVTTMKSMFQDAIEFDKNINYNSTGAWDVSKVENMSSMFQGAKKFNGDISAWKVGNVTNMTSMFQDAIAFNQNINNSTSGAWNVGKVTDMSSMFYGAKKFNGDITLWNIGASVTGDINMSSMFQDAIAFNQNINNSTTGAWNVYKVTDMSFMFYGASAFNGDISGWKVDNVTTMTSMFQGAIEFNQNINYNSITGAWNVGKVTNMSSMFYGAKKFNGNISAWDVSKVKNMDSMFYGASAFNQDITGWVITYLELTYQFISPFTLFLPVSGAGITVDWKNDGTTSTNSSYSFSAGTHSIKIYGTNLWLNHKDKNGAPYLISCEFFGNVINLNNAFYGCTKLISVPSIVPSVVTDMSSMFYGASVFNGDISRWKVGNVINMSSMFRDAIEFNQNINYNSITGAWNVGKVTDMSSMFYGAKKFNGDITLWNIGASVTGDINMSSMFYGATAFNQDLSGWDVSRVTNYTNFSSIRDAVITLDKSTIDYMSAIIMTIKLFIPKFSGFDISHSVSIKKDITKSVVLETSSNSYSYTLTPFKSQLSSDYIASCNLSIQFINGNFVKDSNSFTITSYEIPMSLSYDYFKDITLKLDTTETITSLLTQLNTIPLDTLNTSQLLTFNTTRNYTFNPYNKSIGPTLVTFLGPNVNVTVSLVFSFITITTTSFTIKFPTAKITITNPLDYFTNHSVNLSIPPSGPGYSVSLDKSLTEKKTLPSSINSIYTFNPFTSEIPETLLDIDLYLSFSFNGNIITTNNFKITKPSIVMNSSYNYFEYITLRLDITETITSLSTKLNTTPLDTLDAGQLDTFNRAHTYTFNPYIKKIGPTVGTNFTVSLVFSFITITKSFTITFPQITITNPLDYFTNYFVNLSIPASGPGYSVSLDKSSNEKKTLSSSINTIYTFNPFTNKIPKTLLDTDLYLSFSFNGNTITTNKFKITPPSITMNESYSYFEDITLRLDTTETTSLSTKLNTTPLDNFTNSQLFTFNTTHTYTFNPYNKSIGPTLVTFLGPNVNVTVSLVFSFITITTTSFTIKFPTTKITITNPLDYFTNYFVNLSIPASGPGYSVSLDKSLTEKNSLPSSISEIYTFNPFTNKIPETLLDTDLYLSFSFNGNIITTENFKITPPSIVMNSSYDYLTDIEASLNIGSQAIPTTIKLNTRTLTITTSMNNYTYRFNPFIINLMNYENTDFIITFIFSNGIEVNSNPFKITPYVISLFTMYNYFSNITINELNISNTQITTLGGYSVELSYNIGTNTSYTNTGETAILSTGTTFPYSFNPFQSLTSTIQTRSNSKIVTKTNILTNYLNKPLTLSLVFNDITLYSTSFTIVPYVLPLFTIYDYFSNITINELNVTDIQIPTLGSYLVELSYNNIVIGTMGSRRDTGETAILSTGTTFTTYSFNPFQSLTRTIQTRSNIPKSLPVEKNNILINYLNKPLTLSLVFNKITLYSTPFTIVPYVIQMNSFYYSLSTITVTFNPGFIIDTITVQLNEENSDPRLLFTTLPLPTNEDPLSITFKPNTPEFILDAPVTLLFTINNYPLTSTPFTINTYQVQMEPSYHYFSSITAIIKVDKTILSGLRSVILKGKTDTGEQEIQTYTDITETTSSNKFTFNPYDISSNNNPYDNSFIYNNFFLSFVFDESIINSTDFKINPPLVTINETCNYFTDNIASFDVTPTQSYTVTLNKTMLPSVAFNTINLTQNYTFNPYTNSLENSYLGVVTLSFTFTNITIVTDEFTIPNPDRFKIYPSPCNYFSGITTILGFTPIRPYTVKRNNIPMETVTSNFLSNYTFNPYTKEFVIAQTELYPLTFLFGTIEVLSESFTIIVPEIQMNETYDYFKDITVTLDTKSIVVNPSITLIKNSISFPSLTSLTYTNKNDTYTFNPYTQKVTNDYINSTIYLSFRIGGITINKSFTITTTPFKIYPSPCNYFSGITTILGFTPIRPYTVNYNTTPLDTNVVSNLSTYTFNPYTKTIENNIPFVFNQSSTLRFTFESVTVECQFTIPLPSIIVSPTYDYFKDITVTLDTKSIVVNPSITLIKNSTSFPPLTSLTYTNINDTYTFNPYANSVTRDYLSGVCLSFIFGQVIINSNPFTITTTPFKIYPSPCNYFSGITAILDFIPTRPYIVNRNGTKIEDVTSNFISSYTFNPYTKALTTGTTTLSFDFDTITVTCKSFEITTSVIKMNKMYDYFKDITIDLGFVPTEFTVILSNDTSKPITNFSSSNQYFTFNPYTNLVTSDYLTTTTPVNVYLSFIFGSVTLRSDNFTIQYPSIVVSPSYDYFKDIAVTLDTGSIVISPSITLTKNSTSFTSLTYTNINDVYTFNPYANSVPNDYLGSVSLSFTVGVITITSTFEIKTVPFQMNDTYDYFTNITVNFGFTPKPYQVKLPNKITYDTITSLVPNYTFNPYKNKIQNEYLNIPLTVSFMFNNVIIHTSPFTITTSKIKMKKTYSYLDVEVTLDFIPTSYEIRLYTSTDSISLPNPTTATSYRFNPSQSLTPNFFNVPVRLYFVFDTFVLQSTSFTITTSIQMNTNYDYDEDIIVQVGFSTSNYTVRLYTSTDSISLPNPTSGTSYIFNPSQTLTPDYLNIPLTLHFMFGTLYKSTSFTITTSKIQLNKIYDYDQDIIAKVGFSTSNYTVRLYSSTNSILLPNPTSATTYTFNPYESITKDYLNVAVTLHFMFDNSTVESTSFIIIIKTDGILQVT